MNQQEYVSTESGLSYEVERAFQENDAKRGLYWMW